MGKHPDCPQHGGEGCTDGVVECWSPGGPCPRPNDPDCELCGPCAFCTAADTAPPREVRPPLAAGQLAFRVVASHEEDGVTVIDSIEPHGVTWPATMHVGGGVHHVLDDGDCPFCRELFVLCRCGR